MNPAIHIADFLDYLRADCLRWTMRIGSLRALYVRRSSRLFCHFVVASMASFLLGCAFPLWVLAIGPIVWGYPHLVSSFRYSVRHAELARPFLAGATLLSVGVAIFRLALLNNWWGFTQRFSSLNHNNYLELMAMGTLLCLLFIRSKSGSRSAFGMVLLAFLLFSSWKFPVLTTGILILGHNAIAFLFWIRATKDRTEWKTAVGAFALFILGNVAIFAGVMDPLFYRFSGEGEIGLGLTTWEIGSQITSEFSMNYLWWARATMAYAFGQSVHYFIWLRPIPEQHLPQQTPSSFRQSLSYLEYDLGGSVVRVLFLALISFSAVWLLLTFKEARLFYLCLVAFHGYSEFVGLCFKEQPR